MSMVEDVGGYIGHQASMQISTDIAILLDDRTCRYGDGVATFKLQSLTGLQPNTPVLTEQTLNLDNLMNEDQNFTVHPVIKSACMKIKLPKSIRRTFRTKFIPPGTMFLVQFNDTRKPIIIGRYDDDGAHVEIGNKLNEKPAAASVDE